MKTEVLKRELETMPFDKAFETENGNEELCHATGYEVCWETRTMLQTGGKSLRIPTAICIMADK